MTKLRLALTDPAEAAVVEQIDVRLVRAEEEARWRILCAHPTSAVAQPSPTASRVSPAETRAFAGWVSPVNIRIWPAGRWR